MALLEFIGHAGFVVRHAGVTLLCDPWVSRSGAFLRTWHQYPPNDFIDPAALHDADFLYLSHRHFDHFDREFLAAFPKRKVTVLIAEYLTDRFAREVAALGFPRIVALPDWREHPLGDDFTLRLWRDQTLYKLDSIALVRAGGVGILDKNDCHLAKPDYARFRDQGIDLLLAQFSGAMWYPAAYVYPEMKEARITAGIRQALLDMFVDVSDGVGARHVAHCAGPPCFLDEEFFRLNFSANAIFHDQSEAFDELSRRIRGDLHLVLPGDAIELAADGALRHVARSPAFDFAQKEQLLRAYQIERGHSISTFLADLPALAPGGLARFAAFLRGLFASNDFVRGRVDALVRFVVTGENGGVVLVDTRGGAFAVDVRERRGTGALTERSIGGALTDRIEAGALTGRSTKENGSAPARGRARANGGADAASYEFTLASPIARLLADGDELWEDVFLSMRFRARRDPDFYNWPLFAILQYGHDAALIGHVEETLRKGERDTIVVTDGTERFRIQRYCPHAGEDLTNAEIVDGKVICPRHQWAFDLRCGGTCDRGGNVALSVRQLEQVASAAAVTLPPAHALEDV